MYKLLSKINYNYLLYILLVIGSLYLTYHLPGNIKDQVSFKQTPLEVHFIFLIMVSCGCGILMMFLDIFFSVGQKLTDFRFDLKMKDHHKQLQRVEGEMRKTYDAEVEKRNNEIEDREVEIFIRTCKRGMRP